MRRDFVGSQGVRKGQKKISRYVGRGWGKTEPCKAGAKTSSFRPASPHCHPCMWGLNPRFLIQPLETLPIKLTRTHLLES